MCLLGTDLAAYFALVFGFRPVRPYLNCPVVTATFWGEVEKHLFLGLPAATVFRAEVSEIVSVTAYSQGRFSLPGQTLFYFAAPNLRCFETEPGVSKLYQGPRSLNLTELVVSLRLLWETLNPKLNQTSPDCAKNDTDSTLNRKP